MLHELTLRVMNCSKLHELPYGHDMIFVAIQFMEQREKSWRSQFMMRQHQFIYKNKKSKNRRIFLLLLLLFLFVFYFHSREASISRRNASFQDATHHFTQPRGCISLRDAPFGASRSKPILEEVVTVNEGRVGAGGDDVGRVQRDDLKLGIYIFFFHFPIPPLRILISAEGGCRVNFDDALVAERNINGAAVGVDYIRVTVE